MEQNEEYNWHLYSRAYSKFLFMVERLGLCGKRTWGRWDHYIYLAWLSSGRWT